MGALGVGAKVGVPIAKCYDLEAKAEIFVVGVGRGIGDGIRSDGG